MLTKLQSEHERQNIRPSLADLSNDDFLQKLHLEANKLRHQPTSAHLGSMPSLAPTPPPAGCSKSSIKKSRFAQQRQDALRAEASADDQLPVPTGRFSLDLHSEEEVNHLELLKPPSSEDLYKIPLVVDIQERPLCSFDPPNHDFDTNYQSNGFPGPSLANSTKSNDSQSQPMIPPWELRRLASRIPSVDSQKALIDKVPLSVSRVSEFSAPSAAERLSTADKRQISLENESLLAKMSEEEILREQAALKAQLMQSNPALLTKLLAKLKTQPASDDASSDTPTTPSTSILNSRKHVHYVDQDEVIPPEPSPHVEVTGTNTSGLHEEDVCNGSLGSPAPVPLRFDWNGLRVIEQEDIQSSFDDGIHVHQANTFTFKQLFRLTLSSVPSQRIMGFKIISQIVHRYFESSNEAFKDPAFVPLAQELNDSMLEILMVSSQAARERNLGVVTGAITLLKSIFSSALVARTTGSKYKCVVQPIWIEELLTQSTLLADFRAHFQHQDLPRSSMSLIAQVLRDMVALGDSLKVSEEIVKMPSFLESIVQVLVAVPWPLSNKSTVQVPDLSTFELVLVLAKSSRTCSRLILDRGLLTPMLRFLGLPYWNLMEAPDGVVTQPLIPGLNEEDVKVLIRAMSYQFKLITVFSGYGLGACLRTTLDPILRTITPKLLCILNITVSGSSALTSRSIHELELISSYLQLLQGWMRCADEPHFSDPPHSINWSQIIEWESIILDFLKLSSALAHRPPGLDEVLVYACDLTVFYVKGSVRKNICIDNCLDCLIPLIPQLESIFQRAVNYLINLSDYHELSSKSCASLLISLAKLKTRLSPVVSQPQHQALFAGSLEYAFPDDVFAMACRVAFQHESLSLLSWALSVLDSNRDAKFHLEKIFLAGLLVRNSDGVVVGELLAETFALCQARINHECQTVTRNSMPVVAPELGSLLPIFEDYINQSGCSTQISDPSPRQLQNQISQMDQAAFLLPSTWPLLAISCLKPEYLTSITTDRQGALGEIARASYALTIVLQSSMYEIQMRFPSLSDIFHRLFLDRYSAWKAVIISLIATNSQTFWSSRLDGTGAWGSILEDQVCSQLIIRLLKISPCRHPHLGTPDPKEPANQPNPRQTQESEEKELYSILTDIMAVYDSSSSGSFTFMRIIMPFLSMRKPRGFRLILFNKYPNILKNLHVCLEDVISVDALDHNAVVGRYELENFFYPAEEDEEILHAFTEFLTSDTNAVNFLDHPFLFVYLIHHLSNQIWNPNFDERIRIDLLKIILGRSKEEDTCHFILCYDQSVILDDKLNRKIKSNLPSSCFLKIGMDRQEDESEDLKRIKKRERQQWLDKIFSTDHGPNKVYIDRLKELGWKI